MALVQSVAPLSESAMVTCQPARRCRIARRRASTAPARGRRAVDERAWLVMPCGGRDADSNAKWKSLKAEKLVREPALVVRVRLHLLPHDVADHSGAVADLQRDFHPQVPIAVGTVAAGSLLIERAAGSLRADGGVRRVRRLALRRRSHRVGPEVGADESLRRAGVEHAIELLGSLVGDADAGAA